MIVDFDDFDEALSPEEKRTLRLALGAFTKERIEAIEKKCLERLAMTAEEKELLRLKSKLKNDKAFRDTYITMLIASSKEAPSV